VALAGIHTALGAAKRTSLPIALVLLCATDVMAHEPAPAFVPDSWAGPYIGAYYAVAAGGRSSELADEAHIQQSTSTLMKGNFSGQVTGSMVDLFAGRNWRFGNFVVGGQVEATVASDIAASVTGPLQSNQVQTLAGVITRSSSGPTTNGNDPQLKFRAGLVGRAGFLVRPNLLLYGLAGLEFGHFIFPDDDDTFGTANRNWAVGYTAGAGLEARFDDHWSLRAEYRYLHFATAHKCAISASTCRRSAITMSTCMSARSDWFTALADPGRRRRWRPFRRPRARCRLNRSTQHRR
jgi:opacity protein-like surface antigen